MTEWSIQEHIVKVTTRNRIKLLSNPEEGIDLASSLYQEYTEHVSHIFNNVTSFNTSAAYLNANIIKNMGIFEQLFKKSYNTIAHVIKWLFLEVPLLRTTMSLFDLPGHIAQKHSDMCKILCSKGKEC